MSLKKILKIGGGLFIVLFLLTILIVNHSVSEFKDEQAAHRHPASVSDIGWINMSEGDGAQVTSLVSSLDVDKEADKLSYSERMEAYDKVITLSSAAADRSRGQTVSEDLQGAKRNYEESMSYYWAYAKFSKKAAYAQVVQQDTSVAMDQAAGASGNKGNAESTYDSYVTLVKVFKDSHTF